MANPKYLEVSATEKPELEKGESGLSSASVSTEARESRQSESAQTGVNLTNLRGVATGNTEERSLRVTRETPSGVYVHRDGAGEGFSRSVGDKKQIVNMILVKEVKKLIGMSEAELKTYIDSVIKTIREGQYVVVDTTEYPTLEDFLESTGEQGTVYLYPVENEASNYYQYIWENGTWKSLGSTELDLTDYYTKEESDAKYVDLTSNQTISGIKTLLSALQFNDNNFSIEKPSGANTLVVKVNGTNVMTLGSSSSSFNSILRAFADNIIDLGTSNQRWKDLYLSGKIKDGTNEFDYNTLGLPVISKPASTTLTSAELTRISKGAVFLGASDNKFLDYEKIVFFPVGERSFGENGGIAICVNGFTPEIRQYTINTSNVISIQSTTTKRIRLQSIHQINGKVFPAYPSNTGTFVLKCIDGVLIWVQE